jgi:NADPH-dependent 2,4-dienoyl-CoA reductase/sulfur reductase-like enzyme
MSSWSRATAVSLDTRKQRVELDSGDVIAYGRLLIATGGRNKRLSIPGQICRGHDLGPL